ERLAMNVFSLDLAWDGGQSEFFMIAPAFLARLAPEQKHFLVAFVRQRQAAYFEGRAVPIFVGLGHRFGSSVQIVSLNWRRWRVYLRFFPSHPRPAFLSPARLETFGPGLAQLLFIFVFCRHGRVKIIAPV